MTINPQQLDPESQGYTPCLRAITVTAIFLPVSLAIIKIPGHSELDSLEARRNQLADISARPAAVQRTNSSQTSVMVQRDIFPNDNLEKLAREAPQLASEKERQDWKFNSRWFDKKRKLWVWTK